ncbi:DNA-directed RNA polymerase subunit alpha C-terminal domain-containing protein [Atlantibacter hermannii]|uniref:DNA-directed RNA polymerase subunit alpha C-terminal domain-containing protein n=1 Tax=Atlantibacter hermannii TaxID=565 RepID=UPI0028A26147|nr:DNA-directed RNA polymerase subunit alpha C-terminal domain-containing protein [Atlantibacter hermannii]
MSAVTLEQQDSRITDEMLEMAFQSVYSQLKLTQRRIGGDDLDRRAFETCLATIEQLQNAFGLRLNEEADSYNQLCDTLEELQRKYSELAPLQFEISRIRQEAEDRVEAAQNAMKMQTLELESKQIGWERDLKELAEQVTTGGLALHSLRVSFDNYKRINPERMHDERKRLEKDVSSLRAERKDLNKRIQSLQSKLNIADREITSSRSLTTKATQEKDMITALYENLKKRVDFHDGREDLTHYTFTTEQGTEVAVYIYSFHFGLLARNQKYKGHIIELANFHYQIRTAMLFAMDVVPGVWGNPIYERYGIFESAWNHAVDEDLHQRIMARLAMDFPKIHQRILDAKDAPIDELPVSSKTLSVLKKAGCETILDIASVLPENIIKISGVGEKMAAEITPAINSWCIKWAKVNGDIEAYMSNVIAGSKLRKNAVR